MDGCYGENASIFCYINLTALIFNILTRLLSEMVLVNSSGKEHNIIIFRFLPTYGGQTKQRVFFNFGVTEAL